MYTITVLDFSTGKVKIFKNVQLVNQYDAEEWLEQNTDVEVDNCEWMVTQTEDFEIEVKEYRENAVSTYTLRNDTL